MTKLHIYLSERAVAVTCAVTTAFLLAVAMPAAAQSNAATFSAQLDSAQTQDAATLPRIAPTAPALTPVPDTEAPSIPIGVAATAVSATQINLAWKASTDNTRVARYLVYRDGKLLVTLRPMMTSYQNVGLSASTAYSYTLSAVDDAGNASAQSAPASATTLLLPDSTPPSVPGGLTGSAVSATQINLAWSASTDNVAVSGYRVYRGGALIATLGTVTSYQDKGLTASTSYSYAVQALDAAGNASVLSAAAAATTQAAPDTTPPSVPTGLVATANSPVNLSWTASTDNVAVTGYRVYRDGTLVASPAGTTASIAGLSAGTTYSFTVSAVDAAGNASAQSAPVSVTTPPPPDTMPPSVPGGLTGTAVSATQINLAWSASTDNVAVSGYRVYRGGALVASPAGTSASIAGLSAGTTYSFTVSAVDAAGNASAQSAPASATTLPLPDTTPPSVPGGLTGSAVSATQINLAWSASTDNVAVSGYRVYRGGALIASLGAVTSYQDKGLTASTSYSYVVQALDAAGNASALSAVAAATTQAAPDTTAPTVPTGLVATASSPVSLSWTASTDNVAVTGYRVYSGGTLVASPAGTAASIAGLTAGVTYSFTVSAVDAAGNASAQSAPVSVTIPLPPAPTVSLSASPGTVAAGQPATLTWSSTNASSCAASSGWSGTQATSGTLTVTPSATTIYILSCTGEGGLASKSVTVTVATSTAPTVALSASPASIAAGQPATLNWSSTGASSCTASGGWSGAKASSGSQTITPAATATYGLTCSGAGGSASGSATVTVTTTGAISLSALASRASGVAPLAVFFDATGTTAAATNRPFHELEYRWDFGDPESGDWSTTGLSRNSALGPVAAHVFEVPGTYTVQLIATDGTNSAQSSVQITVADPDVLFAGANTVCVSTTSGGTSFDGCPSGASQITSTNLGSMVATHAVGGKRLLFRRGQTWTSSQPVTILGNSSAPRTLGSFGPGAGTARLSSTQPSFDSFIALSHPTTPNMGDVRIMDLEIEAGNRNVDGLGFGGRATRVTMLRLNIHNVHGNGINLSEYVSSAQGAVWSEIAVADSTIANTGAYNAYFAAGRSALLGNSLSNSGAAGQIGVFRTQYFTRSVMSNNRMSGSPLTFHLVKFGAGKSINDGNGAPPALYVGVPTELSVMSDNDFDDRSGRGGWAIPIGPENPSQDERVRDLIIERNWFRAGSNTEVAFKLFASAITVRNNVIDMSNGADGFNDAIVGIDVRRRGAEPVPDRVHIYNNTIYRSTGIVGNSFNSIRLSLGTNMVVRNNLGYTPLIPGAFMLTDSATGTVASNNSTNSQQRSVFPGFSVNPPALLQHFKPASGYALGGGSVSPKAPVWSDFFQVPTLSTPDIGAVSH